MRAHVIENGVVANTIEVESLDFMPGLINGEVGSIGWLWDGTALTPPPTMPVPVPSEVSNAQAREALIRSGISIASVNAALAAIPDPVEREVAVTQWEYRATIRRDAELVTSMAGAMNLTPAQVDDLFRLAATL